MLAPPEGGGAVIGYDPTLDPAPRRDELIRIPVTTAVNGLDLLRDDAGPDNFLARDLVLDRHLDAPRVALARTSPRGRRADCPPSSPSR